MTYVELIVVLSIFAIITGTVIFNYKDFQKKIDIKNLANDIALKIVEAQKNSTSGRLMLNKTPWESPPLPLPWKPSYGLYFNPVDDGANTGNQIFYYFTDLDQNKKYDQLYGCPLSECIEKFQFTKGNFIQYIKIHKYNGDITDIDTTGLSLTFTRPDSTMSVKIDSGPISEVNYVEIRISSETGIHSDLYIYSSGRVEIR